MWDETYHKETRMHFCVQFPLLIVKHCTMTLICTQPLVSITLNYLNSITNVFPKQKVRYGYNSRKHWLSQGLKDGIKAKNKLDMKYLRIWSVYNEITYKNYRNKLNSILRNAETKYYSDLLTENKHTIKRTWQIMKYVINKNRVKQIQAIFKLSDRSITSDEYLISEKFNDFFVSIGPNLAKKIPSQTLSPLKYMGQPWVQSMFLSVVTPDEIHKVISSLKNGAVGSDEISVSILKMV